MRVPAIKIGTSGWKFEDWAGTFYPLRVPQAKWLEYYAARFPIGEINSTYYRIAPASVYAAIASKTPTHFQLFAKTHADVTHDRQNPDSSMQALHEALQPLAEAGKLLGLLAQFPNSFHYAAESVDYLQRLRDLSAGKRMCVEFRHVSWLKDEAIAAVREAGLTWVTPDEPELPGLLPRRLIATSDILYLRMHGRNAQTWYNSTGGDRYDYDYSEQELTEVGNELLNFAGAPDKIYILFNNCHLGKAPHDAFWLMQWLSGRLGTDIDTQAGDGVFFSAD